MTEKVEEKASDKILKAIGELSELLKTSHKPKEEEKSEPEPHHRFDPDCPTCKPLVETYVNKRFEEKLRERGLGIPRDRHIHRKECKGCGMRGKEGEKNCSNCGSEFY